MNPIETPKLQIRYVVYHSTWGIYLGDECWSNYNLEGRDRAPTFLKDDPTEVRPPKQFAHHVFKIERHEVWPDLPDHKASLEACANALLPVRKWEGEA